MFLLPLQPPFMSGNREKIQKKIVRDKIKLPAFLSSEAHSLLKGVIYFSFLCSVFFISSIFIFQLKGVQTDAPGHGSYGSHSSCQHATNFLLEFCSCPNDFLIVLSTLIGEGRSSQSGFLCASPFTVGFIRLWWSGLLMVYGSHLYRQAHESSHFDAISLTFILFVCPIWWMLCMLCKCKRTCLDPCKPSASSSVCISMKVSVFW